MGHLGSEIHPQLHLETFCQNSYSKLSSMTGSRGGRGVEPWFCRDLRMRTHVDPEALLRGRLGVSENQGSASYKHISPFPRCRGRAP